MRHMDSIWWSMSSSVFPTLTMAQAVQIKRKANPRTGTMYEFDINLCALALGAQLGFKNGRVLTRNITKKNTFGTTLSTNFYVDCWHKNVQVTGGARHFSLNFSRQVALLKC